MSTSSTCPPTVKTTMRYMGRSIMFKTSSGSFLSSMFKKFVCFGFILSPPFFACAPCMRLVCTPPNSNARATPRRIASRNANTSASQPTCYQSRRASCAPCMRLFCKRPNSNARAMRLQTVHHSGRKFAPSPLRLRRVRKIFAVTVRVLVGLRFYNRRDVRRLRLRSRHAGRRKFKRPPVRVLE